MFVNPRAFLLMGEQSLKMSKSAYTLIVLCKWGLGLAEGITSHNMWRTKDPISAWRNTSTLSKIPSTRGNLCETKSYPIIMFYKHENAFANNCIFYFQLWFLSTLALYYVHPYLCKKGCISVRALTN
jgi:hypothetical protein